MTSVDETEEEEAGSARVDADDEEDEDAGGAREAKPSGGQRGAKPSGGQRARGDDAPVATPAWQRWAYAGTATLVVLVLVVGISYSLGYGARQPEIDQARQRADAAEAEASAAEEQAQQALARAQEERLAITNLRESLSRRISLLEARRLVSLALTDLDARNFGLTQQRLQAAASYLEAVGGQVAGPRAERIRELAGRLRDHRIPVGDNLQEARATLLAFLDELDRILGPVAPLPSQEPVADDPSP